MSVFGSYAQYYDLIYQEKDYKAECEFLLRVLNTYSTSPIRNILDLGCGTGKHASILANQGIEVVGVDRSAEMLQQANLHQKSLPGNHVRFVLGDVQTITLPETFDAVVSLFAVLSYMTTNDALLATLQTARKHLNKNGLLFFDAWFGPAVLANRPTDRFKIVPTDKKRIIRFAHPEMNLSEQRVDVHYKILELQDERVLAEIEEVHSMRFYFPLELRLALRQSQFECVNMFPFMNMDIPLDETTWNVAVIARAI